MFKGKRQSPVKASTSNACSSVKYYHERRESVIPYFFKTLSGYTSNLRFLLCCASINQKIKRLKQVTQNYKGKYFFKALSGYTDNLRFLLCCTSSDQKTKKA
jgi:hypothetical protein